MAGPMKYPLPVATDEFGATSRNAIVEASSMAPCGTVSVCDVAVFADPSQFHTPPFTW